MKKNTPKEIPFWDIDEDLKAYGRDKVLRKMAEGQFIGILDFINENGLFKKKKNAYDASGNFLIRQLFASELTEEGILFVRAAHIAWFRSKASAKDPTNRKLLEKYLNQIRGKKL